MIATPRSLVRCAYGSPPDEDSLDLSLALSAHPQRLGDGRELDGSRVPLTSADLVGGRLLRLPVREDSNREHAAIPYLRTLADGLRLAWPRAVGDSLVTHAASSSWSRTVRCGCTSLGTASLCTRSSRRRRRCSRGRRCSGRCSKGSRSPSWSVRAALLGPLTLERIDPAGH
jgi:hypothetical protein